MSYKDRIKQYEASRKYIEKRNKERPWIKHYMSARRRCLDKKIIRYINYGGRGIKFLLTMEEIKTLWFRDRAWLLKKPSINRKDNDGNYTFENCEFIEKGKNSIERNKRITKPVLQYDLKGNFIKEWISATEVERQLGICQSNICQSALGNPWYKQTGGYIWKYK